MLAAIEVVVVAMTIGLHGRRWHVEVLGVQAVLRSNIENKRVVRKTMNGGTFQGSREHDRRRRGGPDDVWLHEDRADACL